MWHHGHPLLEDSGQMPDQQQAQVPEAPKFSKKQIIAGAAARRPKIYIDFGGRTTRAKLISAHDAGITAQMMGSEMPVKWSQLSPARFYGIATRFSPDTPAGHLALARYCAAMGLKEKAKSELQKSGAGAAALAVLVR